VRQIGPLSFITDTQYLIATNDSDSIKRAIDASDGCPKSGSMICVEMKVVIG
jgi:hypothetical protein